MTLNRDILEEYLDGELTPAQAAALEQQVRGDEQAKVRLEGLRRARALRQAALQSYAPAEAEAQGLARRWMTEFAAERGVLARIGPWSAWARRGAAVAAGLLIAAGSFYAGRATVPAPAEANPHTWVVVIHGANGEVVAQREFATYDAADRYAKEQQKSEAVASAVDSTGIF